MSKTKRVKKRNKKFSRKNVHKGGDTSDDFILIGFENYRAPYQKPFFLPINCNLREPNVNANINSIGGKFGFLRGNINLQILILPQLYKLKNIRNIDLWDDLIGSDSGSTNALNIQSVWNQNNGDIVLVGRSQLEGTYTKERYYNFFKNAIIKIELEYPGLFKPIFIDTALTKDEMHNLTSDQKLDIEERAKDKIYKE